MSNEASARRISFLKSLSRAGGVSAVLLGSAVLVGWWADIPTLKTVLPGLEAMKPNAALAFIVSGGSLYLVHHPAGPARWTASAGGALVALLGILTLLEYALGLDLGIDQLLVADTSTVSGTVASVRMASSTAFGFTLLGATLCMLDVQAVWARSASASLGTIGLVIAALALIGYAYDVQSLYKVAPYSAMALHAAAGLFVLFVAAAFAAPDRGWAALLVSETSGGAMARRLLPAIIGIPLILGYVAVHLQSYGGFDANFGTAVFTLSTVVILTALAWQGAISLNRIDAGRRRAEDALHKSEALLQGTVSNVADAIVTTNEAGIVQSFNRAAETLFGYAADEVRGRNVSMLMPEPYHGEHDGYIRRYLRTGVPRILGRAGREVRGLRKDGTIFPVELMVSEMRLDGERLFIGALRDLTERKATEAQLRQAQKMESVGLLAGGIAHDFNNILTIILGNLERLKGRPDVSPAARACVESGIDAVQRGAALTRQLLAFSRKQILEPTAVDVNKAISGLVALLRRTLGEDIEIETVLGGGLWRAVVDSIQLEQALLNLAVNARDAMPTGGKLTIETANARLDDEYAAAQAEVTPGQYVMLGVTDTGTGMPPEVAERVFEPFFTTKELGRGTGLGLSQVYGFIKQSGGHVKIYSEVGHGTTVKMYLPRAPKGAAEALPEAPGAETPLARGETLLVVEDDQAVRELTADMLADLGYRALQAESGLAALAILERTPGVDLVLTDVILSGGMSGRALYDETKKRFAGLKVLFMSGYTENAITHHGRLDPGVELLQKPFRRQDLARKVRRLLDQA